MSARLPRTVSISLHGNELDLRDATAYVYGYSGRTARGRFVKALIVQALRAAERDDPAVRQALDALGEARGRERHPSARHLRAVPDAGR